ncbi:tRNA (adenosine(37)-N6)-threonylcarbamoyltransferase complex transferase subunit TsaD [Acanthopleuribacter pedis]|uniref:tRNA N6-adenosine threonylcarbamoyltransferase n=1 Tax=Acanthopleuribacter pedis TaxID=442870 RepID=A0A8J7Q5S5_9BACT|nr:tRNA (adenosine(37)-N6)-threonylcarbamoyltransferase complex transferase subunit TsaD [Acanthopleuribacter pedis]MBO1320977.1 tRNA (adenosine(37)-N6)-threonylcarbamoyltransferase complex transferase subunit TsaD [Acanthopleuribacter pedis]
MAATIFLGVESSCDDTSIAVINNEGTILANVVSSQIKEHAPFGGVVPELASRAHLRNIPVVFQQAMDQAQIGLDDIDVVAVTHGPGLIGSLLVGVNFAKSLAFGRNLPLVPVNHIRGHIRALFLEHGDLPLPALTLIVSGGHTHLFLVETPDHFVLLAKTRDDAAGEAFDKLAKMLDLGFPGGAIVDKLAQSGDPKAFPFNMPRFSDGALDYSFSGLKTAAAHQLRRDPQRFSEPEGQAIRDLCASFQSAVVRHLLQRVRQALKVEKVASLSLGGGVACNSHLRQSFRELGDKYRLPTYITAPKLSTDNAAMIAAEGRHLFQQGITGSLDLNPEVRLNAFDEVRLLTGR